MLEKQRELLLDIDKYNNASGGRANINSNMDTTIQGLKDQYAAAHSDKDRAGICSHVERVASGFQAMTQASISLAGAIKSGDPFAISASSLDLATSLVGTVSLLGGPIGAAVGAVLGAILSIISMILKMFQKEEESLLSQIEQMARKLQAETQIQSLLAASGHLKAFTTTAINAYAEKNKSAGAKVEAGAEDEAGDAGTRDVSKNKKDKPWSFSDILLALNSNTTDEMLKAQGWLAESNNQELELWGEALALFCQAYASFKIGIAYWLPVIGPRELHKLMSWKDTYDPQMLSFVKTIKPAARNRGIICHAGASGIYLRDVVISPKAKWKDFGGYAHAVVGAYRRPRPGNEPSANPPLSIFHLGKKETFDNADRNIFAEWKSKTIQEVETEDKRGNAYIRSSIRKVKLHPFSKKSVAYDFDGHWPLTPGNWNQLDDIKGGAYDIWAIRGESPEEIDVYTATGSAVRRYTEGGAQHIKLKRENPTTDSYKVRAVRAVRPKTFPDTEAVYQLCEDAKDKANYPFKIWAFFISPGGTTVVDGTILPPRPHLDEDWRNFPTGIAVDSVHFWVFSTSFLACASHINVKQHLEKNKEATPDWMTYHIPSDVLGYDPSKRVSMGLSDLSACDDGTLTAVLDCQDGQGRIFTATPRFEGNKLVIDGKDVDKRDHEAKTHGWIKDPESGTHARRVHKLPIFCWSIVEGLEDMLTPKKPA